MTFDTVTSVEAFACTSLTLAVSLIASTVPLRAQEPQPPAMVEDALRASDGAEGDTFGASVVVAGDIMIVAAPWADRDGTAGAVYVYLRDTVTGAWVEHQRLLPAAGTFGDSFLQLNLAIEGETIVVGAPDTTLRDFQEGAVHVFERDNEGLWAQSARLADPGVDHGGHFGGSLALEGSTLVVGAPQDSSDRNGLVYIFDRDVDNVWTRSATITHSAVNDAAFPKSFGASVSLDGDLLLVGAPRTLLALNTYDGAAYLFRRRGPARWDYITRLVRPGAADCTGGLPFLQFNNEATAEERKDAADCADLNPVQNGSFGRRVALDGELAAVTADSANAEDGKSSVGEAHLFAHDVVEDAWAHSAKLGGSLTSASAHFGNALALNDGAVLVGAASTTIEGRSRQGSAHLFQRAPGDDRRGTKSRSCSPAMGSATPVLAQRSPSMGRGLPSAPVATATFAGRYTSGRQTTGPMSLTRRVRPFRRPASWSATRSSSTPQASSSVPWRVPGWNPCRSGSTKCRGHLKRCSRALSGRGLLQHRRQHDDVDAKRTHIRGGPAGTADRQRLPARPGGAGAGRDRARWRNGETGGVWTLAPGTLDTENDLFVVALGGLYEEGATIVLIEHSAFELRTADSATLRTSSSSANFEATCHTDNCAVTLRRTLTALEYAYGIYSEFFDDPFLVKRQYKYCRDDRLFFCEYVLGAEKFKGIGIYLLPGAGQLACDGAPASTAPFARTINICIDIANHSPEYFDATIAHELFHAFQYGLEEVWETRSWQTELWIMEATASAASGSISSLVHPPGSHLLRDWTASGENYPKSNVRRIDKSLNVPKNGGRVDYEAQDFWVHFGQVQGLPVDYLKLVLEQGTTATGIDTQLVSHFGTNLADAYWRWVKNQTMLEDGIDFYPDSLGGPDLPPLDRSPCVLQPKVVAHDPDSMEITLQHRLTVVQPGTVSLRLPVTLLPLQADVVEIDFPNGTAGTVEIGANGTRLRHKVYLDRPEDIDSAECRNVRGGDRTLTTPLPPGAKAYVLLANTQFTGAVGTTYEVRVDIEG